MGDFDHGAYGKGDLVSGGFCMKKHQNFMLFFQAVANMSFKKKGANGGGYCLEG